MSRIPTRRSFLAAVGAGSFAMAGCTGIVGEDEPGGQAGTPPRTETESPPTTTAGEPTTTTPGEPEGPGTLVEDFEDLEGWDTIDGTVEAETNDAFAGSQSVRIENPQGGAAGIEKRYPDGLDLSADDLSIAVKMEKPAVGKLAVEYLAPYRGDHLTTHRYIVEDLDDWARVDLGYTAADGTPDLSNVKALRILVLTQDEPIRFWIDDLRKSKKPDRGKVVLTFDDAHATQYDVAFPELQERDVPGVAAVIPGAVGTPENLTVPQLREMRDAGWDVSSHPQEGEPLTAYPKAEQRRKMEAAKTWLEQRGFADGSRFFFAPYDRVDGATLELVDELHEYGFVFGASPNGAPPAGEKVVSRVYGRDVAGVKRLVELAASYGQMVVINYGAIGEEFDITPEMFRDVLDHVESQNVDVVTPSGLLEME